MAKATLPILFLVLLLPYLGLGVSVKLVYGEKTWCVAKPSITEEDLLKNMASACTIVDCTLMKPKGQCFNPNVTISHASAVMNLYYQASGRNPCKCDTDFNKAGLIVKTDPSFGSCNYA